jgi:AAHS family 4-hydroxybenzoate transporter-like MFS transporter
VGASLGVGRIGALLGPLIGGALVAAQWSPQQLLWAAAVAPAVSTAVIVTLWFVLGPTPRQSDAAAAPALAH